MHAMSASLPGNAPHRRITGIVHVQPDTLASCPRRPVNASATGAALRVSASTRSWKTEALIPMQRENRQIPDDVARACLVSLRNFSGPSPVASEDEHASAARIDSAVGCCSPVSLTTLAEGGAVSRDLSSDARDEEGWAISEMEYARQARPRRSLQLHFSNASTRFAAHQSELRVGVQTGRGSSCSATHLRR